jgi:hypothetical protein
MNLWAQMASMQRTWNTRDLADRMVNDILRGLGHDMESRERIEQAIVNEALERLKFTTEVRRVNPLFEDSERTVVILNTQDEELTLDDKKLLAETYEVVKAEYKQRREAEKAEYERQRQAEADRRKAEYDAGAAPFREARRLKMQKRFEAEQARKAQV